MNRRLGAMMVTMVMAVSVPSTAGDPPEPEAWLKRTLQTITSQLQKAAQTYTPGTSPRSLNPDGSVRLVPAQDWTSGFSGLIVLTRYGT